MQKGRNFITRLTGLSLLFTMLFFGANKSFAHCDGLDGPVVKAAQKALETGNVNLVLIWVRPNDEAEIKKAFEQTLQVRKLSPQAQQLADMYFFETLVRIHRAGEGAPYTGLKPAGRDLGPAIPAGDKALEAGSAEPLLQLLTDTMHNGLHETFSAALAKKRFNKDDVEAGREYVQAYVTFIHYVEGLYEAAKKPEAGHSHETNPLGRHEEKH
ncbi:MAG: DUF6448 family protein [candidate division KSB1 bacterium]|nr:DUF6448 family protein [candidate division KSB1 bacterium]MDZ7302658.1 DUF6448 family protein [candidate division KSB1 bacterium]MDZ7311812.1 DUF6448 family protein [candidate division KSB1 bacterium]